MLSLLLVIGLLCTIAMGICVSFRYHLQLIWKIQKKLIISTDSLITTKEYQNLAIELIILSLAPLPGLHATNIDEVYQDLEDPSTGELGVNAKLDWNCILLAAALIFRMYIFVRYLVSFSRFRDARQQRLCLYTNDSEADFMFAIKAIKQEYPFIFVLFALLVPLLVMSYCTRIFERPLIAVTGQNFDSFSNCMWLTMITMATVGYGDYFPSSYFGRVIGMLSCFWGVFTLSTFVVILNNLLAHN